MRNPIFIKSKKIEYDRLFLICENLTVIIITYIKIIVNRDLISYNKTSRMPFKKI